MYKCIAVYLCTNTSLKQEREDGKRKRLFHLCDFCNTNHNEKVNFRHFPIKNETTYI